jgi:hypothetical protein
MPAMLLVFPDATLEGLRFAKHARVVRDAGAFPAKERGVARELEQLGGTIFDLVL